MSALPEHPESIHPALWRATQLARAYGRTVDNGSPALSAPLPGAGWPVGTMIELLLQQAGIGEMRLLSPAFAAVAQKRSIALVAPQQTPHALGYAYMGVHPGRLMWLTTPKSSDALWSAEQILRIGSCCALVLWQQISARSRCDGCCSPLRAQRRYLWSCAPSPARKTRRRHRFV